MRPTWPRPSRRLLRKLLRVRGGTVTAVFFSFGAGGGLRGAAGRCAAGGRCWNRPGAACRRAAEPRAAGPAAIRCAAFAARRSARLLRHDSAGLRGVCPLRRGWRLRRAAGLRALSGARRTCRLSRTLLLLALLLPALTRARAYPAAGAALSLPAAAAGRLAGCLGGRRARLLLARTVVLTGLAVRPLRLLSGRRVRPQLLLLRRLDGRGMRGLAAGLARRKSRCSVTICRPEILRRDEPGAQSPGRARSAAARSSAAPRQSARRPAPGPDRKTARALRQRAEPRAAARSLTSIRPTRPSASG